MKLILVLILGILYAWNASSQEINFSELYYNFHTLDESDGKVSHDFYFMNTGEKPLRIREVLVPCGCVASEWPRGNVQPGEKGVVRITYDPANRRKEALLEIVEVYTNAGVVNLTIEGLVKLRKQVLPVDYQLKPERRPEYKNNKAMAKGFDLILSRMREGMFEHVNIPVNDSLVLQQVNNLRRGGNWLELDYKCYGRSAWEPIRHLDRVYQFALAYVAPESKYFGNDTLFLAIQDALGYWLKVTPKCHNWWCNEIAVPQRLGDILVLLDSGYRKLPDTLQNGLYGLMAWPDPRKWTGANKQDIAQHHLQRGCLLRNDSIVREAAGQLFYPVRLTNQEGLQVDFSYHQHGNQLYVGGYGAVFVGCVIRTAEWLRNTSYALQDEQLKLFSRFIRETYLNVYRGPYLDYTVLGRGVSRRNATRAGGMSDFLDKMKSLDPNYAMEYEDAKERFLGSCVSCRKNYSRVYWRSDYTLHNRSAFDFSVRTASVRASKIEGGNGENLKGALLSDGATCLRVQGDEYYNIFPYWNWNHIPGVTAPDSVGNLFPAQWGRRGKSVFSGGVSDGQYSAMAYQMNDFGVEARKAWFMFDGEVVCLGAGIRGNTAGKIITTVEQRRKQELVQDGGRIVWDDVLYYFPEGSKGTLVHSPAEGTRGSWFAINYNYTDELLPATSLCHLYIDHGVRPSGAGYAYVLAPGVKKLADYDTTQVVIVRNDTLVQGVYQKELDVLQLVCYGAARYEGQGISLDVDIPCVMMVRGVTGRNPQLYLADPMQDKKVAQVRFRSAACNTRQTVKLPLGDMKGSSIKIEIKK